MLRVFASCYENGPMTATSIVLASPRLGNPHPHPRPRLYLYVPARCCTRCRSFPHLQTRLRSFPSTAAHSHPLPYGHHLPPASRATNDAIARTRSPHHPFSEKKKHPSSFDVEYNKSTKKALARALFAHVRRRALRMIVSHPRAKNSKDTVHVE